MEEFNLTEFEKMLINMAYSDGRRIGDILAENIKSGNLKVPENETLEIIINKVYEYDFPLSQKILAKIGSPKFGVIGNFACASGGAAIGGVSLVNYFRTKNFIARIFYGTGTICGGTAAIAGSVKVFSGTSGLLYFAVGGDMIGGAYIYVGNRAKDIGDIVDGKKSWSSWRRSRRNKPGMGYRGLSFVTSSGFP